MARPARHPLGASLARWLWVWFLSAALAMAVVPIGAQPTAARQSSQPAQSALAAQVKEDEDEEDEEDSRGDEEEEEEEGDADLEVWEGSTFAIGLEFDPEVWELYDEDSGDGYDFVSFFNGPSFVSLSASNAYDGDHEDCFEDWAVFLEEESEDIEDFEPLEDEDGDPIEDEGDDFMQAAFSFVSPDGEEVFDLECRVLIEGEATLAILLETFEDQYEDQVDAKDELLEGLDLSGLEEDDDEEVEEVKVEIVDFAFDPDEIEVAPGTTVTWTNEDDRSHTVTSEDDEFDSGRLDEGESFSFTFEDEGEYPYFCKIHDDMTGVVIVTE